MKFDTRALLFGGIVAGIAVLVVGGLWFASLFTGSGSPTNTGNRDLFSALFPFGNSVNRPPATPKEDEVPVGGLVPRLRQISAQPIAGFQLRTDGTLRYGEVETGHIYETRLDSLLESRISNTTIPGIRNIVWPTEDSLILQYLDGNGTMRNFLGTLASSTPDQFLNGAFFSGGSSLLPGNATGTVTTLTESSGGLRVERVPLKGGARSLLFSSSLRSWKVFPRGGRLFVATSPHSGEGSLFIVETDGSLQKIIEAPGLMTNISSNGRYVAFSILRNAGYELALLDRETGRVYQSPIETMADKCAWMGNEPVLFCGVLKQSDISIEDWYMGLKSTSDSAWIIDFQSGAATFVINLEKEAGTTIDVISPEMSPDGEFAVFRNKDDLSLWSLDLER